MLSIYILLPTDLILWKVSITIHAVTREFSHASRVILGNPGGLLSTIPASLCHTSNNSNVHEAPSSFL